jgi:hypothetical protein
VKKFIPVLVACALAVVGAMIFGVLRGWESLAMSVTLQNLTNLLSPIAFAAAMVERGVEILISPWRDAEASKLERNLAAIQAQPAADTAAAQQKAADLKRASDELDEYRGTTQRYAFAVSLILSTLVSIAGVRAFEPFLDVAAFKGLAKDNPAQHGFFLAVDIAVSATVLAGGADGVHSVVNAVTTFFDSTAAKSAKP